MRHEIEAMHPILRKLAQTAEEREDGRRRFVRRRSSSHAALRAQALAKVTGVGLERILLRTAELLLLRLADLDEGVFGEQADGATRRVHRRLISDLSVAAFHRQDNPAPEGEGGHLADTPVIAIAGTSMPDDNTDFGMRPLEITMAVDEEELVWTLSFQAGALNAELAERFPDFFETLLENGLADPRAPASRLPYLSLRERERVIASARGLERDQGDMPVCERILRAPTEAAGIAVEDGSLCMTYGELERRSRSIALGLRAADLQPRERVGVFLERSAEWVAAMIGVMRADMVYVPLSTQAPLERLAHIVDDAGLAVVVGDPDTRSTEAITRAGATILTPDALADKGSAAFVASLEMPVLDSDAYVIYTSGSTGMPKGVRISHRSLANYVEAARGAFGSGIENPVFLQFADAAFDVSLLEVFYPLCHAGRTVIHRPPEVILLKEFARTLQHHAVSIVSPPTAFWNVWSEAVVAGRAIVHDTVEAIVVGGEVALPWRFAGHFGRARLFNAYGPTEATVDTTIHACDGVTPDDRQVPIGRPLANCRAYILDRQLSPVAFGVLGEIVVAGAGVAQGYVGRPDADAARFVDAGSLSFPETGRLYRTGDVGYMRADGTFVCLGREDTQMKISGVRIDLAEIERALESLDFVEQAVVVRRNSPDTEAALAAFVRPGGPVLSEDEMRCRIAAMLARRIASAAIPSTVRFLQNFPLNLNAKVDRNALAASAKPEVGLSAAGDDGPADAFERFVWETWHALMTNQALASTAEDLFQRQVSSLKLGLFFAELADALDIEIELEDFETSRSVATIAARLKALAGPHALPKEASS